MHAEFQRIESSDKKAFLSDQCKEIENNQRGKTSIKLEISKEDFIQKMGTIKDRNSKDLIEQRRSGRDGKNTQKNCTKKISMTWITMTVWSLTQSQTFWSVKSSGS